MSKLGILLKSAAELVIKHFHHTATLSFQFYKILNFIVKF